MYCVQSLGSSNTSRIACAYEFPADKAPADAESSQPMANFTNLEFKTPPVLMALLLAGLSDRVKDVEVIPKKQTALW